MTVERTAGPPTDVPPALAPALARFERGDFAGARAEAEKLLADGTAPDVQTDPQPDVAKAARALLARIAPDPWALRIGLLVLALLAVVTGLYVR